MHQARLKVLHNRERFIEELLQEARKRLYAITKDTSKYSATLGGLITQVSYYALKMFGVLCAMCSVYYILFCS